MIRLKDVEMEYPNGTRAIRGISTTIEDGEFVFLVGPSGSGKSTIIKLITAEIEATRGKLMVNGYNLRDISEKQIPLMRRTLGVIFQDFRLIVHRLPAFEIQVDGQIGILEFQLELDGSSSDTSVSIGGHFS